VFGGLGAWALSGGDDTPAANASNDPGRASAAYPGAKAAPRNSGIAPNSSAAAVARGEVRLVYDIDFAKAPAFLAKYSNQQRIAMDGEYPTGWTSQSWRPGVRAEVGIQEHAGSRGVAIITTEGDGASAELQTVIGAGPFQLAPGKRYLLRTEYANIGTHNGSFEVRFDAERPPVKTAAPLQPTGGQWQTADLKLTAPPHQKSTVYFTHYEGVFPDFLIVRSVQVYEFGDGAATAPAAPRLAFEEDFSKYAAFKGVMNNPGGLTMHEGRMPDGWTTFVWREGAAGEIAREEFAGKAGLALRTTEGQACAEVTSNTGGAPKATVKAGHRYRVEAEYAAPGTAGGRIDVRLDDLAKPGADQTKLEPTGLAWKTGAVEFAVPSDKDRGFVLHISNYGVGQQNTLFVRTVKLIDLTPDSNGPATAGPGVVVYQTHFGSHPAVKVKKRGFNTVDQTGELPAGIETGAWNESTVMELAIEPEGSSKVLALRNLEGGHTAMVFLTDVPGRSGIPYWVTVEYQSSATPAGMVRVLPNNSKVRDVGELPGSGGEWKTVQLPFRLDDGEGEGSRLEIHAWGEGAASGIRIRSVTVTAGGPLAAGPAPAAQPGYRLDLAAAKSFAHRYRKEAVIESQGDGSLPAPWAAHTLQGETLADVFVETVGGSPALGLRNHEGPPSVELFAKSGLLAAKAGKKYTVRVTYQTEANGKGGCQVLVNGEEAGGTAFAPSVGAWKDVELTVAATADGPLTMTINCGSVGNEASVYVKAIEIKEVP